MTPKQINELTPKRRAFLGEALRCGLAQMHKSRIRSLAEAGLLKERVRGGYYVPAPIARAYAERYSVDITLQKRVMFKQKVLVRNTAPSVASRGLGPAFRPFPD